MARKHKTHEYRVVIAHMKFGITHEVLTLARNKNHAILRAGETLATQFWYVQSVTRIKEW